MGKEIEMVYIGTKSSGEVVEVISDCTAALLLRRIEALEAKINTVTTL